MTEPIMTELTPEAERTMVLQAQCVRLRERIAELELALARERRTRRPRAPLGLPLGPVRRPDR